MKHMILVVMVLAFAALGITYDALVMAEGNTMTQRSAMITHFKPILGMPIFGRILGGALGIESEKADSGLETAYEEPAMDTMEASELPERLDADLASEALAAE